MEQKQVKNPFTGRMIKVDGPTYKRLMDLGDIPVVYQNSTNYTGWKKDKPAKGQPSKNLLSRCNKRCFLNQYPICQKLKSDNKCKINCRALQYAKEKSGDKEIAKNATLIAINKKCKWARSETKFDNKRCNAHKVEPYSKCITMQQDELLSIAKNCDSLDVKGTYRREIDKMDKKQLCGYIMTHPKKRVVKGFTKQDYIEFYEVSKETPIPLPDFMEEIMHNEYPDITDKKYLLSYLYLYLLIRYRDRGVLYNQFEFDNEAIWFCGNNSTGANHYLKFPENFENDIKEHPNQYLFLELNILECEDSKDPHANLLIFDTEEKTMSRWESNIDLYNFWKQELLDSELDKFAESIGYRYQTTYEVCSSNFNTIGEATYRQFVALLSDESPLTKEEMQQLRSYELDGPCQLYEALFIEYRFYIDSQKSIDAINRELIDHFLNSEYTLTEFLYKYRNYIMGELHQFILEEFSYDGEYDPDAIDQFIKDNEKEIIDVLND